MCDRHFRSFRFKPIEQPSFKPLHTSAVSTRVQWQLHIRMLKSFEILLAVITKKLSATFFSSIIMFLSEFKPFKAYVYKIECLAWLLSVKKVCVECCIELVGTGNGRGQRNT